MIRPGRRLTLAVSVAAIAAAAATLVAQRGALTPEQAERRWAVEKELAAVAVIDRKVMLPMRDGVRLATDVYRPKDASTKVPAIFVRTPYNFNFWDVRNGVPGDMTSALEAVKRGYAYVIQNERGHFFSEGNYDILGSPADGYDTLEWISAQPWSNGKVGTTGCSSTAEYQMGVAALGHPSFAAMNVQSFGAGVGRIRPYFEQGNWYRGGAVQMLFITWLYGEQNQVRPMFPPGTSQADLVRASKSFDLGQQQPRVDWSTALWHLPDAGHPQGRRRAGGHLRRRDARPDRRPDDAADARTIRPGTRAACSTTTCSSTSPGCTSCRGMTSRSAPTSRSTTTSAGRRGRTSRGSSGPSSRRSRTAATRARRSTRWSASGTWATRGWHYQDVVYGFFDRFLKGEASAALDTLPRVTYFTMGSNRWQTSDTWPPAGATPVTYYLSSRGKANTMDGDGALTSAPPAADAPDAFTYDPAQPVTSYGGNVCCTGTAITPGSFDQRKMEVRQDILVYTSEPFKTRTEFSGPIVPTLYVSSDAKDTDFTVKVIDVYPDGRAYNLDESIQRMRWRDGYEAPPVWMEPGRVYRVTLQPLTTSNDFEAGHRLRIEVSSSNFPRFDRNLNTGGNNYDEDTGVVAHNVVHHSKQFPSHVTMTVVRK